MSFSSRASEYKTVTIAATETESAAIKIDGYALGSYSLPSAMTGSTISFKVSNDGTTYTALVGATASAVSAVTHGGARQIPFPAELWNFKWAKIVSGSAEGAERTIGVFLKA